MVVPEAALPFFAGQQSAGQFDALRKARSSRQQAAILDVCQSVRDGGHVYGTSNTTEIGPLPGHGNNHVAYLYMQSGLV